MTDCAERGEHGRFAHLSLSIRIGDIFDLDPTSYLVIKVNDTYSIREVIPADIDSFWQLRLQALHDHPGAFGADYEASRALGPPYAEHGYFEGGANRLFAAFTVDGVLIAQAGVYGESGKRGHIANIISVYTHPDHRGHGLASRLVQVCVDHLKTFQEITSIRISVNASNAAAIHTYQKIGFETWGEEPDAIRTADGSCHNELHMVLTSGARRS